LKQNCKTTTSSSKKISPQFHQTRMPKKLAVEKKIGKNQKRTHSPKSRPPNTPNTDKHTQNPKKEGGKKNRQRTKTHTANFLIVFL
jgi:hypothetical protein